MLKTEVREGKTFANLDDLTPYYKNPRGITREGLDRLKKQITLLKEFKPLVVNKDGIVLGGNMRYKAYKELGIEKAWVSIVDAQDDATIINYNLADNDKAGFYDQDLLLDFAKDLPKDFDASLFKVDLGVSTSMADLLANQTLAPPPPEFVPPSDQTPTTNIAMVQLFLTEDTKGKFLEWCQALEEKLGTDNLTDTVFKVVEDAYNNREESHD